VWGFATAIWAGTKSSALYEYTYWVRGFVAVLLIVNTVNTKTEYKVLLKALIISVFVNSSYAIVQWLNQGSFESSILISLGQTRPEYVTKKIGFFARRGGEVNTIMGLQFGAYAGGLAGPAYFLGTILSMTLPIILAIYIYKYKSKIIGSTFSIIALLLGSTALLLTLSRGAIVGFILAIVSLLLIAIKYKKEVGAAMSKTKGAYAFGVGVCVLLLFSSVLITNFLSGNIEQSASIRLAKYGAAIQTFAEHPILGVGLSQSPVKVPLGLPNNIFLGYLVELGVIGLILYVSIIISVWKDTVQAIKVSSMRGKIVSLGLMCGVIGFLGHSQFDWVYRKPNVSLVFWIIVALLSITKNVYGYSRKS
jgi:O-antigen ligase